MVFFIANIHRFSIQHEFYLFVQFVGSEKSRFKVFCGDLSAALPSGKAVSAYLYGKQILSLSSMWQSECVQVTGHRHPLNTRCR